MSSLIKKQENEGVYRLKGIKGLNLAQDFPILQNKSKGRRLIYLDSSSTSQKPKKVINRMKLFYQENNANVHRGIYALSRKATEEYELARQIVADFINAEFEEVIFTKGTTESLNLLAYSLGKTLQPGDEIVLSVMEHHSNIVPWQRLAQEKGCQLKYIPLTTDYRLNLEKAQELITEKTKIVSVTHMSNVLGTINPIKALADLAHDAGAVLIVDAAQSIPFLPINVKEMNCDFLAFSGHKMCGPTGIGILYGKKDLLEKMDPFLYGGDMIKKVDLETSEWNDLPWKFEAGTPAIAQVIGLAEAVKYLQEIGSEKIAAQERVLTSYALERLSSVANLKIIGPLSSEQRGAVFSFVLPGIHSHDVSEILDRQNIAVRGGHHCAMPLMKTLRLNGTTRASFYLYNTKEDVDDLIDGIKKVKVVLA